jgi:hypothetical protein
MIFLLEKVNKMEDKELVLVSGRARRLPAQMYVASIAVKGTETNVTPQFLVYSPNATILKILINSHNELIKIKKEMAGKKSK